MRCVWFFSLVAIPVYVKHNIIFREGSSQGRFDLTLGPKQTMGKAVESVLVSSQLPRGVLNVSLNPSQGTYTFDPVTKVHRCFRSQKSVAKKQHVLTEGKLTCPYNFEYFDIHRVNYRNLFFKLKLIGTSLLIYRELGTKYAADIEHWAISRCRCCPGMLERSTHRNFPV